MNHSRGAFTAQISRKRKERDDFFLPSHFHVKGKQLQSHSSFSKTTSSSVPKPVEPVRSNRILAGFMAHEFLTKGTLLGQKFDPARAQAQAQSPPLFAPAPQPPSTAETAPKQTYAEVASLLKTDGAHIPGIVNPSQLARWIQKGSGREMTSHSDICGGRKSSPEKEKYVL